MPVIFFSGGIDSTVIAYDVGINPHRYGITVNETTELRLLIAGPPSKKRQTKGIVRHLSSLAKMRVVAETVDDSHLVCYPAQGLRPGGNTTLTVMLDRYGPDLATVPYTPGWMLWMASVAVNRLAGWADTTQDYNPEQAFLGHQWNGPVWRAIEKGDLPAYDSVPAFYTALDAAVAACHERVRIRVPFLDNRMDRAMIVQLAIDLGVPLHETSSCLQGWKKDCGACSACLLRQGAFRTLGLTDEGKVK